MRRTHCLSVFAILLLSFPALPQAGNPAGTFTDPKEAGPDFAVQGEYEGDLPSKGKLAAQVVALGAGKFDVYFLAGGLPGAGWDGKTRVQTPAQTSGEKTVFGGSDYTGEIAGGKLTGKAPGGESFTLKHVLRQSPTLGAEPPAAAVILFDGSGVDHWDKGKLVESNLLACGTKSKKGFSAGKLHLEFRTPFKPKATGQGRGNSGVYVLGKEIQVLDSFGLSGAKNESGAFYGNRAPDVNMCLPPLSWQTYDVEAKPGETVWTLLVTVWHNGVKIH